MARNTGVRRKMYWSAANTTIAGIGSGDVPTAAELETAFTAATLVGGVTRMPGFGTPPATVPSEEFGEDQAIAVASQSQQQEATVTLTLNESSGDTNHHVALQNLANGAALTVAIFTFQNVGTGTNRGHPAGTNAQWVCRLIEGTKAGTGEIPESGVNDLESYTLGIAVVKLATVRDLT